MVVRRSVLTDLLADALDEGTVESGVGGNRTRRHRHAASGSRLSDGTTREVAAVIGADGIGSMVARHLNGTLRHRYAGYTAWRGVAEYALDPSLAGETVGIGTEFGHVPLGAGPHLLVRHRTSTRGQRLARAANWPTCGRSTAAWADPDSRRCWRPPTRPTSCATTSTTATTARQWSRGPVVLVGDAAHPMRPHLGQGGCQGLEDAATLAHCVGAGDDLPAAFARFAALRRPRAHGAGPRVAG